jgi:hypothetical protein
MRLWLARATTIALAVAALAHDDGPFGFRKLW